MLGGAPRRSAEHRRSAAKHLQWVNSGNGSGNLPGFTRILPEYYQNLHQILVTVIRICQDLQDFTRITRIYQNLTSILPEFHQKIIYQDFTRIYKTLPDSTRTFTRIYQDLPDFTWISPDAGACNIHAYTRKSEQPASQEFLRKRL